MAPPVFSRIWTRRMAGSAFSAASSRFQPDTARATASSVICGTDRSCRGAMQMTLQMPVTLSALNKFDSSVEFSAVSGSYAGKSFTNRNVPS